MERATIYEAVGGMPALRSLAASWHDRAIEASTVAHAFSHGYRDDHEERLAAYLAEALGGPPAYSSRYGDQTSVLQLHAEMLEHPLERPEMADEAIAIFADAVQTAGLPNDPELRQTLKDFWTWAMRHVMTQYRGSADDVPTGLTVPRWSWDGPVEN